MRYWDWWSRPRAEGGFTRDFTADGEVTTVRIDTPAEAAYYQHGGILQYVLRQLLVDEA